MHCQSPLPRGVCASLPSVTAAQGSMCICAPLPSVTAARGSTCIVSHRCSREHVHRHRCVATARGNTCSRRCSREHVQSPLLEERARQSRWSGMCELVRVRGCGSYGGAHAPPDHLLLSREFARQGTLVRRRPVSALAATAARGSLSICTGALSPLALREHALREHAAFPDAPCSLGVLWCALEARARNMSPSRAARADRDEDPVSSTLLPESQRRP